MQLKLMWQRVILLFISLYLLSCQSIQDIVVPEIECERMSHTEWYDYYWSGLVCMDEGKWSEAQLRFKLALKKRNIDERRVYTTGMHWITDYFPNRELGITLIQLNKFADAAKYLNLSLSQFPSTKAEFYLNKSRVKMTKWLTKDKTAPLISAKLENGNVLKLSISDDSFIEQVKVNDASQVWQDVKQVSENTQVSIQRAKPKLELFYQFDADSTKNLKVEAVDIFNKSTGEMDFSYLLDSKVPQLTQFEITRGQFDLWQVSGLIVDADSGIKKIWIDGKAIVVKDKYTNEIEYLTQNDWLTIKAVDFNGNQINQRINLIAGQSLNLQLKPLIALTQYDSLIVEGEIDKDTLVDGLQINGKQVSITSKKSFSHKVPLIPGVNEISILLVNQQQTLKQIHQVHRVFTADIADVDKAERLKVALFPFECDLKSGLWCNEKNDMALRQAISEKQRFNLVELAQLDEHIQKIKLCEVGLIEDCTRRAMKLIQSNTTLVGQIVNRTSPSKTGQLIKGQEAYIRMLDHTTGDILIGIDAYFEQDIDVNSRAMPTVNQQLFDKLHEKFPILSSTKMQLAKQHAQGQFEFNQLLWPKMPIKVFADDKRCAIGKINQVSNKHVEAELATVCDVKSKQLLKMVTM